MKVGFRQVLPGDADVLQAIGPDRQAYLGYGGDPAKDPPGGPDWAGAIIARIEAAFWGRVILADDAFAGEIRLHNHSAEDASARLAIGLYRPELRGLGLGRRAIGLAPDTAFTSLELHRVELRVLQSNRQAIRCYKAAGFRHEGTLRDSARIGHEFANDLVMAVLSTDRRPSLT